MFTLRSLLGLALVVPGFLPGQTPPRVPIFHDRMYIGDLGAGSNTNPSALPSGASNTMPSRLENDRALIVLDPVLLDDSSFAGTVCNWGVGGQFSFSTLALRGLKGDGREAGLAAWMARLGQSQVLAEKTRLEHLWHNCGASAAAFPLRLLAIVNRIDLFRIDTRSCGELRFVYGGFGDADDNDRLKLFVILEFVLGCKSWTDTKAWAQKWDNLRTVPTDQDRTELESVLQFGLQHANSWRVRTNQHHQSSEWLFQEFLGGGNALVEQPLAQTPVTSACDSNLQNYVSTLGMSADPMAFDLATYMPARPRMRYGATFRWLRPLYNDPSDARYKFAVRTCVGCHSYETRNPLDTETFAHIQNRKRDEASVLSGFMKGIKYKMPYDVIDCGFAPAEKNEPERIFHDLWRRQEILNAIVKAQSLGDLPALPRLWEPH